MNDPFFSTFHVCYSCFTIMWTFLVQINTSVVGKTIYGKKPHNDLETKKDVCFDNPSYPPVSWYLIG